MPVPVLARRSHSTAKGLSTGTLQQGMLLATAGRTGVKVDPAPRLVFADSDWDILEQAVESTASQTDPRRCHGCSSSPNALFPPMPVSARVLRAAWGKRPSPAYLFPCCGPNCIRQGDSFLGKPTFPGVRVSATFSQWRELIEGAGREARQPGRVTSGDSDLVVCVSHRVLQMSLLLLKEVSLLEPGR